MHHFHAGGAASRPLLDPWSHGFAVMRELWASLSTLDLTQIGSLVAVAGMMPSVWQFFQRARREVLVWIKRCFLASVTIPGGDPLNRSVVQWILANRPRHNRFFTGRTEFRHAAADGAARLKKSQHPVQYCPHWESQWFWYNGHLFLASRNVDNYSARFSDPNYDGLGGEELTISCFGWSAEPVKRLIEHCREYADQQTQYFVIIYARDRYGLGWKPKTRKPIRLLDTVHFDNKVKQELLADIRNYLDPQTQMRYHRRSMPYRRGYLFYGPPGTGKTSLSIAIAGEFGLDLYEVKIPSVATDADLEQMFQEIPPRCVVLLEDIDAVWVERSRSSASPNGRDGNPVPNCTLSGLLNVLDGVGSQEGRIVIMTTNRPDELDSALIRPGRVDMKVFLGNISQESAREMFLRMYAPDPGCTASAELQQLAAEFARRIPPDTFTPSLLQGFFQLHLDSPHQAVLHIDTWVQKELAKLDREFEVISGRPPPPSHHGADSCSVPWIES